MESRKKNTFIALEKLMAHFCDAIICISEAEKISALREGICKEDKLHVIENGIDIEEYKKEEVALPIPEDVFVVGMVGRICRQKAPDVFVKMAGEVHKEIKNSFFIILIFSDSVFAARAYEDRFPRPASDINAASHGKPQSRFSSCVDIYKIRYNSRKRVKAIIA